jgi:zinc transport system ATP-binding protein
MTAAPLLSLTDVCVEAGRHQLLRDVCLTVGAGEMVGIAGVNGAGKTSLLRAVLPGASHRRGSVTLAADAAVGYLPQHRPALQRVPLSVRDVVATGLWPGVGRRLARAESERRLSAALVATGTDTLIDRPLHALSGGEYQKVSLARALVGEPALLLLDEPFANLDLGARLEFAALLQRLHDERGFAALIVVHDLDLLPAACRRLVVIEDGAVVFDGNSADRWQAEVLRSLYGANATRVAAAHREKRCRVAGEGP